MNSDEYEEILERSQIGVSQLRALAVAAMELIGQSSHSDTTGKIVCADDVLTVLIAKADEIVDQTDKALSAGCGAGSQPELTQ